ncbi:endosome to lysosome transport via multivesicular body sorting pathway [Desmophyllum pertusum]|uniref:Endosome to lysosome transport via multivesicular body sorting pathway n=1 Tax=Desmophyllum pertusum TaxID=174260 RepID=A0A9W9YJA9_9CNID|nr:endosome to lysosome transport via multivesicular body sorting pathway [Desmophyllum pertusum]
MASKNREEGVSQQLREAWSSYMRCSTENPQEKSKHLELFIDIHSVSNVLTSEFQSTILVRCQDETDEESLVEYLCQGQGLLLLQILCILASKVAGWLDLVFADFDDYWWDTKSTSRHTNLARDMILQLPFRDSAESELNSSPPQKQGHEIDDDELLKAAEDQIDKDHHVDFPFLVKSRTESPSTISLTSVTDIDSALSANISECSDTEISSNDPTCSETISEAKPPNMSSLQHAAEGEDNVAHASLAAHPCINNFQLSLLLISTLENLTCHSSSSLNDSDLLMHTSGQLIDILCTLSDAKHNSVEVLCEWEAAAVTAVHLVMLRTVFAILYTACRNPKAAKQLSKTSYVRKLLEVVSEGCLDKDFATTLQHVELAKLVSNVGDDGRELDSKLSSSDLWRKVSARAAPGLFVARSFTVCHDLYSLWHLDQFDFICAVP